MSQNLLCLTTQKRFYCDTAFLSFFTPCFSNSFAISVLFFWVLTIFFTLFLFLSDVFNLRCSVFSCFLVCSGDFLFYSVRQHFQWPFFYSGNIRQCWNRFFFFSHTLGQALLNNVFFFETCCSKISILTKEKILQLYCPLCWHNCLLISHHKSNLLL